MKTRQNLYNYFILLSSLFLLASCEKEEKLPEVAKSILGEWILDKVEIKTLDSNNTIVKSDDLSGFGTKINFKNDDTYLKTDPDDALKLNQDIDNLGTWEFTNNHSQIIFSRGVYSFGGKKELIWRIRELTNESFIAATVSVGGLRSNTILIYHFNRTSQSGSDTSPKEVLAKKWQLDKVDFQRNQTVRSEDENDRELSVGDLLERATVKGYGADINFLTGDKYIFDSNNNPDYEAIFGTIPVRWIFNSPYKTLEILSLNKDEGISHTFEVKELTPDKLVLYLHADRVGEVILGEEEDFHEEFLFTFTPFDQATDAAQKSLHDIFFHKWFISQIDAYFSFNQVVFESGSTKGYGENLEFLPPQEEEEGNVYAFDQAGNPNFAESLESEGAWQLPFPYTKLWVNPEFSAINEDVLEITKLTDNEFVISTSEHEEGEGFSATLNFEVHFVHQENFEALPSPKDSLEGEWELVHLNAVQTRDGVVIAQFTDTNFNRSKLTFKNVGIDDLENCYFSAPRNPELLSFFPSEATWQFSMLYQYVIINDRAYRVDVFEEDRIVLSLSFPADDGTVSGYTFTFLRFGTRNEIPTNAVDLLLGEWELDSLMVESFDATGILSSNAFELDGDEMNFESDKTYSFDSDIPYLLSVFHDSGTWNIVPDPNNDNVLFVFISNVSNQDGIPFFIFKLSEDRLELFREYDDSDEDTGRKFKTRELYIFNK